MDIFGSFSLLLALIAAVYAIVAGIIAIRTRNPLLTKSARHAGIAVFLPGHSRGRLRRVFFSSPTIFRWRTSRSIAIAISRHFINSPLYGRARKARSSFGAGCFRFTHSSRYF